MSVENPPAFPAVCLNDPCHPESRPGMTLRDWFAGQALAGLLNPGWETDADAAPAKAYSIADAMLAERAKGGEA